jgi:HEAT repeat protein
LGEWLYSKNQKGNSEFAEDLARLGTNTVSLLTNTLAVDSSVAVREVSAMALGNLGAPPAMPALTNALIRDQAQNVREAAARALEEIGDAAALPALGSALRTDSDNSVRAAAISAFATVGGTNVVPELLAASRNETNWEVRVSFARTLADFQDTRAVPVFAAWLKEQPVVNSQPVSGYHSYEIRGVIEALGQFNGEPVFELLIERWQIEPVAEIRASICAVFGLLGDPRATPLLREALGKEDEVRAAAAEALGQLGDTNSVPALTALLDDPKFEVRKNAAAALGRLRGAAAVPTLLQALERDSNDELRAGICRALGQIGDPTALATMLKVLPQMTSQREPVLWAIGHLGHSNAIPVLGAALRGKEREERFTAAYALAEIGGAAAANAIAGSLDDKDEFARHGKACALAMLGWTNGMSTVRTGLRAKEQWRRFGSTLALAALRLPPDSGEWQPVLEDPDPALRRLGNEAAAGRVVSGLVEMLRDQKRDYRQYAARGLLFFRDPAALPALREACRDRDPAVREAAETAVNFIARADHEK